MTGLRDEKDIERILRSTLTEVAGTVSDLGRLSAPVGSGHVSPRNRSRRWAAPLAAAAAVALIASVIGLQTWHGVHKNAPVVPPISATSVPPSPSPSPTQIAAPTVKLEWWTTPIPYGYTEEERVVTTAFSGEQLIRNNDPQRNTIGDGGGPAGVLVRRWSPGAFNASTVASPLRVKIGTRTGLFGATPAGLFNDQTPYAYGSLPTLAVQVAPDRWVTIAGETALTQQKDELIYVALTVLSRNTTTAMKVPFQLNELPTTLHVLGADEDLDPTHPYGLHIDITDGPLAGPIETVQQTTALLLQVWQQNTIPTSPTGGHITADGRTGVLDTTGQAAYFPIGTRLADIEFDGPNATASDLQTVLAGLTWSTNPNNESTWYDATKLIH